MDDNLMRQFYSLLFLCYILCPPERGRSIVQDERTRWRRFLNDLCWVCDAETAGKTVVAIAVEQRQTKTRFWVSSNEEPGKPSLKHTHAAVGNLKSLFDLMVVDGTGVVRASTDEVELQILRLAISIGRDKVRYYSRRLHQAYTCVVSRKLPNTCQDERQLCDDVKLVLDLGDEAQDYTRQSSAAYSLRAKPSYTYLQRCVDDATTPFRKDFVNIRHYVGRLASWAKSATYLAKVSGHNDIQMLIRDCEVRAVPASLSIPGPFRGGTDLTQILSNAATGLEVAWAEKKLTGHESGGSIQVCLRKYTEKDFQAKIHAELPILQHFRKRKFLFGLPYIACSKPPCFCCHLYTKLAYRNMELRPTHGNIWMKWSPLWNRKPSRLTADSRRGITHMIETMKQDVKRCLLSNLRRGEQKPDSITDLDTTLPSIAAGDFSMLRIDTGR